MAQFPKEEVHFYLNKHEIDICKSYKYIGVAFNSLCNSSGNTFRQVLDYTCEKAHTATLAAQKKCTFTGKPTGKVGCHLFYGV